MKKMMIAGLALMTSVSFAAVNRVEVAKEFKAKDLSKVEGSVKKEIDTLRSIDKAGLAKTLSAYSKGKLTTAKVSQLIQDSNVETSLREMGEVMKRLGDANVKMSASEKETATKANEVAFNYLEDYATYASTLPKESIEAKVAQKLVVLSPSILLYSESSMAGFSSLKEEIMNQMNKGKNLLEAIRAAAEIVAPKAGLKKGSELLAKVEECAK